MSISSLVLVLEMENKQAKFSIKLYYCSYGPSCKPLDEVLNELLFLNYRIVTANTYYDHSDIEDPIKSYIKLSPAYKVEPGHLISHEVYVKPSEIKRSRGRSDMVYELAQTETVSSNVSSHIISQVDIRLDPYYDVIEVDYVEYNPISVMAQIGGLLSFLKFIFDLLIAPIMKNVYVLEMINSYNIKRIEKRKKKLSLDKNAGLTQINRVIQDYVSFIVYICIFN